MNIIANRATKNNQYLHRSRQQINISHSCIASIEQLNHPNPRIVKNLSLAHCSLQSLQGIENYTALVSLNLKFNNLENAQQILLIPNKQLLVDLNLQGNTIQYYSLCTFASLRAHGFVNLQTLNNKDYSKWHSRKRKVPAMHKINSKLDQVQKQMTKTLKRVVRNNVIEKYRLMPNIEQDQNENENEAADNEVTSRYSQKQQHYASSFKCKDGSTERNPLREISLSNVNIIKSVKAQYVEQPFQKPKTCPQLVIQPIEFNQNQISHMPLTQPTATFASQKQKENMPFRRKNNNKSIIAAVEEDEQNCFDQYQQISQIMGHCQRPSYSITRSRVNMNSKSFFAEEVKLNLSEEIDNLGTAFYNKHLLTKFFKLLRPTNMPRKVQYF